MVLSMAMAKLGTISLKVSQIISVSQSTRSLFIPSIDLILIPSDRPHALVITAKDSYFHGLRFVQPQMW